MDFFALKHKTAVPLSNNTKADTDTEFPEHTWSLSLSVCLCLSL